MYIERGLQYPLWYAINLIVGAKSNFLEAHRKTACLLLAPLYGLFENWMFSISILMPAAGLITRSIGYCPISCLTLLYTRGFVQFQRRKSNGLKSSDPSGHDTPSCVASVESFSLILHVDYVGFSRVLNFFSFTVLHGRWNPQSLWLAARA